MSIITLKCWDCLNEKEYADDGNSDIYCDRCGDLIITSDVGKMDNHLNSEFNPDDFGTYDYD